MFAACTKPEQAISDLPETTDNYRTYYQIFPYSFADSNGDGKGDLQGIIDNLDYIASLNFDGIWLTPVHQSTTYHKYDVVDYKSIDKEFGTMEDYDRLVDECHKRGMSVLLDLVFNHTSSKHVWFDYCITAHKRGEIFNQYYNYYNVEKTSNPRKGWSSAGSGLAYEAQFWDQMPDLNWKEVLDHPDGYLANDLKEIMRFWLIDHKVDGFRLDAVSQLFTGDSIENRKALKWINDTAKSIKSNCYIVGEGPWDGTAYSYYESGADSFFLFNHGFTGGGSISMAARTENVEWFTDIDKENKSRIGEKQIPAMFVSNHDVARAYGILQGGVDVNNMKLGYGVMAMCEGATFWYYGDEVGMNVFTNAAGDVPDENRRQPMPWGNSYTCTPVKGSTAADDSVKYPLGNVPTNLADANSLVNYIARANALRRAFPQIARNYGELIFESGDSYVGLIRKGEGSDAIYIAVNVSHSYSIPLNLEQFGNFKLAGTLSVDINNMPTLSKNKLTLPPMSFAVLQKV